MATKKKLPPLPPAEKQDHWLDSVRTQVERENILPGESYSAGTYTRYKTGRVAPHAKRAYSPPGSGGLGH